MFLSLPLADDGFATTPIAHRLLIGRPHLLVNLNPNKPRPPTPPGSTKPVRQRGWGGGRTYLQPTFLRHVELVVAQQERPDLLAYGSSHTTKIHKPVYLLLLIGLNIGSHTVFSFSLFNNAFGLFHQQLFRPWEFLCASYRGVLEDLLPDLQRKASLSVTGYIRINDGGVDQSGEVRTDCGQMATVSQPWEAKEKALKTTTGTTTEIHQGSCYVQP